jgi:hypothetical protein
VKRVHPIIFQFYGFFFLFPELGVIHSLGTGVHACAERPSKRNHPSNYSSEIK